MLSAKPYNIMSASHNLMDRFDISGTVLDLDGNELQSLNCEEHWYDGSLDNPTNTAKQSIAIICCVHPVEAWLLGYSLQAFTSCSSVTEIVVVLTRKTLETSPELSTDLGVKCKIKTIDYGSGYDIPVSDGGYDQIRARNAAISMVSTNPDWIVQVDADDFYDQKLVTLIEKCSQEVSSIVLPCYNLLSPTHYANDLALYRIIDSVAALNPHQRIFRYRQHLKYVPVSGKYVNLTRHCVMVDGDGSNEQMHFFNEPLHVHLHNLIPGKPRRNLRARKRLPGSLLYNQDLKEFLNAIDKTTISSSLYNTWTKEK
ncbi:MAG: hypothetical protein GY774_00560 [Planctomycetes bacterium]|nr:hypothetical protein [Planctomycetota bacterium]